MNSRRQRIAISLDRLGQQIEKREFFFVIEVELHAWELGARGHRSEKQQRPRCEHGKQRQEYQLLPFRENRELNLDDSM